MSICSLSSKPVLNWHNWHRFFFFLLSFLFIWSSNRQKNVCKKRNVSFFFVFFLEIKLFKHSIQFIKFYIFLLSLSLSLSLSFSFHLNWNTSVLCAYTCTYCWLKVLKQTYGVSFYSNERIITMKFFVFSLTGARNK